MTTVQEEVAVMAAVAAVEETMKTTRTKTWKTATDRNVLGQPR